MFLTCCNKIKWRKMGWGALITFVLVLAGVFFLDQPLFLFLRNFNGWLCSVFDNVFSAHVWIMFATIVLGVLCAKKIIKSQMKEITLICCWLFVIHLMRLKPVTLF